MKNKLLAFTVVLLAIFFNSAKAQSDSTKTDSTKRHKPRIPVTLIDSNNYDLGRMSMQKKFTQAITIKSSALDKLPFSSINEVIGVYYNGIYADEKTFVYVVNGILNTDVNAYSIYDIDELTIIQNAASTLNGLLPNQVLVLVTTKKNLAGKSGISINGQTSMVRLYQTQGAEPNVPNNTGGFSGASSTGYYHQYYVSGYVNKKNINMGLSASIQHNVFPVFWNKSVYPVLNAYNTNRFRFNAYADIKMGKYNILSLNGGYVPQRDREYFETASQPVYISKTYISQNLWYSNITLKSNIVNGLSNKLSAGFQRRQTDAQIVPVDSVSAINSYLAKDELSYQFHLGDFNINAAVNATYRQAKDTATRRFYYGTTAVFIAKQKTMAVTPSLTINYADIAMLQGGVQKITYTNAPVIAGYDMPKMLPFGSASVNVLRPFSVADTDMRLMLFGTFARVMSYASDEIGTLAGRTNPNRSQYFDYSRFNGIAFNPYQTFDQLQGGLIYSVFKNTFTLSYNYSSQKFVARARVTPVAPPYVDTSKTTAAHIIVHRVGINFVLPTQGNFKWSSYLNGAMFIKKEPSIDNLESGILRLYYPGKNLVTGGFLNQFAYKNLAAGVDLLYAYNKELRNLLYGQSVYYPQSIQNISVLKVQNVYIGYKVPVNSMSIKSLEVYANGRNVFEKGQQVSINQYYAGDSRYLGVGFKLDL